MDRDQEHQWAQEIRACLERWIKQEADRIAALPSVEARREALAVYRPNSPTRLLERLQEQVTERWARGRC